MSFLTTIIPRKFTGMLPIKAHERYYNPYTMKILYASVKLYPLPILYEVFYLCELILMEFLGRLV